MPLTDLERFNANVTITPTCHLWTKATNADGYGTFTFQGRKRLAHHVAYILAGNEIPDGMELDHLCHRRNCVNVQHLEPVTHTENLARRSDRQHNRIDRILAEELSPDALQPTVATYNASAAITHDRPREPIRGNLNPYPPGVSGNPGGVPLPGAVPAEAAAGARYTISRALREALTLTEAKRIAATAVALAAQGSPRHMEYVRDTTEGKPGVRIADGEWNPEQAPTFNVMLAYRERFMSGAQTPDALPPASGGELEG